MSVVRNTAPFFVGSPYSGQINRDANNNAVVATYTIRDNDNVVSGQSIFSFSAVGGLIWYWNASQQYLGAFIFVVALCFVFVFVMHFQIWTCFPLLGLSAKFVIYSLYLLHVHTSLLIHWIFSPLTTWGTDFTSIVCLCMLEFVSLSCRQMDLFGFVFVFTSFSTVCRLTDFSIYCFLLLLSSFCVCSI